MKPYFLFYGMSYAGMGPDTNGPNLELAADENEAGSMAYDLAVECAQGWEGSHGIPYFTDDEDQIAENPDEYEHFDNIDSYIDYYAEEVTPERLEKYSKNWNTNYQTQLDELLKE